MFTLRFKTDSEDFDPNARRVCAEILRDQADQLEDPQNFSSMDIRDFRGRKIGSWKLTEDRDEQVGEREANR